MGVGGNTDSLKIATQTASLCHVFIIFKLSVMDTHCFIY